ITLLPLMHHERLPANLDGGRDLGLGYRDNPHSMPARPVEPSSSGPCSEAPMAGSVGRFMLRIFIRADNARCGAADHRFRPAVDMASTRQPPPDWPRRI